MNIPNPVSPLAKNIKDLLTDAQIENAVGYDPDLLDKTIVNKKVEDWLMDVAYDPNEKYVPSLFSLEFINFIKLVEGGDPENKTPVVHYKMIDNFVSIDPEDKRDTINMCHRGIAKALDISTRIPTPKGWVSIKDLKIGDYVFGEDGKPTKILGKSEVFNRPMYQLNLVDGRSLRVCEDHINTIIHRRQKRVDGKRVNYLDRRNITTKELLNINLTSTRNKTTKNPKGKENKVWIPLPKPVQYPSQELPIDPYTLGLLLGDGSIDRNTGYARLYAHKDDMPHYLKEIPYVLGKQVTEGNNSRVGTKGIGNKLRNLKVNCHGNNKFVPEIYKLGSIEQRLALLQGLMDTDGTVYKNGCTSYTSNSFTLIVDIQELVFSLGGTATVSPNGNAYRLNISLNLPLFRLPRKLERQHFSSQDKVALESIHLIDQVPSQCIAIDNKSKTFVAGEYVVTHNSTLKEYLILYLAVFGALPGFGKVPYAIYISDSIENGVKKMRKSLEYRYNNSEFLQKFITEIKFTDIRWEFINKNGNSLVVSGYGAKALALDTELFTEYGKTTIKDVRVGDRIYGADGKLTTVTLKSEVFNRPMYSLKLADGRSLNICEDHLNSVVIKDKDKCTYTEEVLTTKELIKEPLQYVRNRVRKNKPNYVSKENLVFIKNCDPIQFSKKDLPIDPYTLGVILGDGRINKDCGSVELTGHIEDFEHYLKEIPYTFGKYRIDKRNSNVRTQSIRGLGKDLVAMGLNVHGDYKFIPKEYLKSSIEDRLALLQGLMDTDGTVSSRKINSVTSFTSNSVDLIEGVKEIVYSLGGYVHQGRTGDKAYRLQIHLNMPIFRLPRKAEKHKCNSKTMVPVVSITPIEQEPSQCIRVNNKDHEFIANTFFRTHNTGVRGTRENNSRPVLALLDDLISDSDARSATVIADVEDTVYKAVDYALHPKKRKIIWSGTPFNSKDPLYKAVESGAWKVNVYPVCERFPCSREEFRGSWPDRFDYDYVNAQYVKALRLGKIDTFNQELMLRIMSDEDRLIKDHEIQWYKREQLLNNRSSFNFYITTDFATSDKEKADFSSISVWAINYAGKWFLVDGILNKQNMAANVDDLFRLAQMYNPQQVGIEVSGQQGGFIDWIKQEMLTRNIYFNIASDNNSNRPGIRPLTNKFKRFSTVTPWFTLLLMHFPIELKETPMLKEAISELELASNGGFKSKHDDFIDSTSMLSCLQVWKPSAQVPMKDSGSHLWEIENNDSSSGLDSYLA